jgi:hypothetical protein
MPPDPPRSFDALMDEKLADSIKIHRALHLCSGQASPLTLSQPKLSSSRFDKRSGDTTSRISDSVIVS